MTQVNPSSFDIGRKGSLQLVLNLNMCQKVDDTLVDGCGIWEHLHSFRVVKCLFRVVSRPHGWIYRIL